MEKLHIDDVSFRLGELNGKLAALDSRISDMDKEIAKILNGAIDEITRLRDRVAIVEAQLAEESVDTSGADGKLSLIPEPPVVGPVPPVSELRGYQ